MANEITINYPPANPGAKQTQIDFFSSDIDLQKIFYPASNKEPNENDERRLFVTDTNVASLFALKNFISLFKIKNPSKPSIATFKNDVLLIVKSGEKYKTIETVLQIVKAALDNSFARKDLFVGIGGGVITDMTGFASSMFKRGARVAFVPTTLLAMVDASLGGKTGCDFGDYKNMTGAFFPAEKLYVFPEFIKSQSKEEYRSGLAEAIKTALLFNKDLYSKIKANREKIENRDSVFLFEIIKSCMNDKAQIVENDFMEKNIRMFLNLGHTFGHALETCAGLGKIKHGDAVAWGISRSLTLSCNINLCEKEYKDEVIQTLSSFGYETSPLPKIFSKPEKILSAMKKDKKNSSNKIKLVLQKNLTENVIEQVSDDEILKVLQKA